jgi:hypothetical protein
MEDKVIGTNWEGVARELGFANAKEMWSRYYPAKSIDELRRQFNVSAGAIRAQLVVSGLTIQSRGGVNFQKVVVTEKVIEDIAARGMHEVARELNVPYATLYKAVRRWNAAKTVGEDPSSPSASEAPGTVS